MLRSKIVKRRTKNRQTLLRNLRKGKARQEPRCRFETIPYPLKFALLPQVYHLYADVVLMEHHNTFVIEASLINNVKVYKQAQVFDYSNQKVLKLLLDNKSIPPTNCERIAEEFEKSQSSELKSWAGPIKAYCQRYQKLLRELIARSEEVSDTRLQSYIQMNEQAEKTRFNLFKTYPCYEMKSQLKDGQIQLTEIKFNQKFLNEIGYTMDSFATVIFQEGLPNMIPFDGQGAASMAKLRLENYLTDAQEGYQSPEVESLLMMNGGYSKKTKMRHHFHSTYEKGVPGFSIFGIIVAKQKPVLHFSKSHEMKINTNFVQLMSSREKQIADFLGTYYGEKVEQKYTNLDKVCHIREISSEEEA